MEKNIFPRGEKITNNYFIGDAYLQMLATDDKTFGCTIGNVSFEPGARNNWHTHGGGQILLVTDGIGYYQEEGKPIQTIKAGDTILIAPGIKHWHGASKNNSMSHLAINTNTDKGVVEWLEPVTDDQYNGEKN